MAGKIDSSEKNVKKGLQEYEDIAKDNNDYGTILSGAKNAMTSWDTTDSAIEEGQKSKEKVRSSIASSFDPLITHDWFAPGYQEDKENVKSQYEEIKKKKGEMKGKRKAVGKAAKEKADEEYNKIKDEIYQKASERIAQERNFDEEEGLDSLAKKANKAKTWNRAEWLMSKMGKRNPVLKKEVTADVLDLNEDERKELSEALKNKLAAEKNALDEYDKLADTKEENKKLDTMKKAYWKARNDLNKKQAPYAIRNAFLIIDAIQKSFQNIGRALPKSSYSPAYTNTAFEEPQLFKLWREQIEKGQERQQDVDKAVTEALEQNIKEKYAVPQGASKAILDNQMKWKDKFKDQKLSVKEKEIATDLAMELEKKYADYYDENTIKELALAETMRQAGKTDAMDTYYNAFVHNNIKSIESALRSLTVGGQAKNALVAVLEAIEQSTALKAATLGIANDVLRTLAAGIKEGVPSFENNEQGLRDASAWLYRVSGGKPQDALSIINHAASISPQVLQKQAQKLGKISDDMANKATFIQTKTAELDAIDTKIDELINQQKEIEASYNNDRRRFEQDREWRRLQTEVTRNVNRSRRSTAGARLEQDIKRAQNEYDLLEIDFAKQSEALESLMLPDALKKKG